MTTTSSFKVTIMTQLMAVVRELHRRRPEQKDNVGGLLSEVFLWDTIADWSKKQAEAAWKKLEKEDLAPDAEAKKKLEPGSMTLAESPKFVLEAKVSQPVNRFSPDALAMALKRKYKIPEPTSKLMIENAKVPTSSMVTMNVVERGL